MPPAASPFDALPYRNLSEMAAKGDYMGGLIRLDEFNDREVWVKPSEIVSVRKDPAWDGAVVQMKTGEKITALMKPSELLLRMQFVNVLEREQRSPFRGFKWRL